MKIPTNVKQIMQKLLDNKFEAYIIGGAVRDFFLGKDLFFLDLEPNDYDVFTNATGNQIIQLFPKGKVLGNEERQAKILTVIVDGVEVSQYRSNGDRTETGNSLGIHLSTCDFRINAISMDIDGRIFDPQGGCLDVKNKILRFVGDGQKRIDEDPLRILRGYRFKTKYNLEFDTNSIIAMINNIKKIYDLPQERVRDEFMKILVCKGGMNTSLMTMLVPETKKCKDIKGGDHHDETPLDHMYYSYLKAQEITDKPLLMLTAYGHDIGKGETVSFDEEGKQTHFYQHEKVGAKMAEQIMMRLKFSKEEINYVTTLIKLHMYSYKTEPKKKSYIRFFAKLEAAGIQIEDYIMLLYCDNQGNMAKPRIKFGDFIAGNWLYKKYFEYKYSGEPFTVKDLEISGKDLIGLGMKPGKAIGNLLNELFDEVMDAKLKNFKPTLMIRAKERIEEMCIGIAGGG